MGGSVFGRSAELAALASFLDVAARQPAGLVIGGEAGIGKTTLWREAVALATARNYRVLSAAPTEAEYRLPFSGLNDLLAGLPEKIWTDLSPAPRAALEVALLRASPDSQPAQQRAIAVGLLTILRRVASIGPLLLAVDDVQWLDLPTRRALEFANRRLDRQGIGILLSLRGEHLAPDLERSLPAGWQRLNVKAMSLEATDEMLASRLSSAFSHPTLQRIHRTSGGNPFFALEIGRFILARGAQIVGGAAVALPENLRELVRGRLAVLPHSALDALLVVAAASQPSEAVVAAVIGENAAAAGLSRAIQARIVESTAASRLRFTHPLIASVLYEESSLERRRRVHAQLARLRLEPQEQARHLALSSTPPDADVATALERGAEQADRRGAPDGAAWLMEQAVAFTPKSDPADLHRRHLLSADYQFRAGDMGSARSLLSDLVAALPAGRERAAVLQRLGRVAFWDGSGLESAEEVLHQALREAGPDLLLKTSVERDLVLLLSELGKLENAAEHASKLIEDARALADPEMLAAARVLGIHAQAVRGRGVPPEARAQALATLRAATKREAHPGWADTILFWGAVLKWSDDFEAARIIFNALLERMSDEHDESSLGSCLFQLAELECWAGDYDRALRLAERGRYSVVHAGHPAYLYLVPTAAVAAIRGRLEEAKAAAEEAAKGARATGRTRFLMRTLAILGFTELSRGEPAAAIPLFAQLRDIAERQGYHEPGVLRFDADQIEALVGAGRSEEAEPLADQLERRGRTLQRAWAIATGARCRGLILAARGDLDGALVALARALQAHSGLSQPLEFGRTLLVLGTIQRRAKQRRLARESLERALALFVQLGATLWAGRARAELARIGGRAKGGVDLTVTERRVAELATMGRTNREIAARLFMTVRTVEANLSRVYEKLEVRSRAELASKLLSAPSKSGVSTDSPSDHRP